MQIVNRLNSFHKLIISIIIAVIGFFFIPLGSFKPLPHLIFSWDIFCLVLLILSWITFYSTPFREIRKEAQLQDTRRVAIFFIVLITSCASMLAVILLLTSKLENPHEKAFQLIIGIACMSLSWFLLHTIFTTRYAYLYYADHETKEGAYRGGLDFPEEPKPDFLDFAYFAFTIGMTFQASDVDVTKRRIRRLTLWHSILSFMYNATIIAMTVNIIGGLSQS